MKHRPMLWITAVLTAVVPLMGQSNIDPASRFAWCENVGWTNWRHNSPNPGDGVVVSATILTGFVFGENIGWINLGDGAPAADCDGTPCYANLDGADFGVNVGPDGALDGMGWGENIGWINFEGGSLADPPNPARLELCDNTLAGYAWGENIGWINLDDATHFVALGPGCAVADVACDGVIGLFDYAAFQIVLMGPVVPIDCPVFDSDADGNVDLVDFGRLQENFTG